MKPVLKNSILDTGVPPLSLNDNGEARRIGVEIEFGGLYLRDAVNLVITTLGGTAEIQRHNAWKVVGTKIGDLIVEIDADILQGNKPAGKSLTLGIQSRSCSPTPRKMLIASRERSHLLLSL